jgi:hypothetical protein
MSRIGNSVRDSPQAAGALLAGSVVASRQCPAPGCDRPLKHGQRTCSAKIRAALSRRRKEQARQAVLESVKDLLRAALLKLEGEQ